MASKAIPKGGRRLRVNRQDLLRLSHSATGIGAGNIAEAALSIRIDKTALCRQHWLHPTSSSLIVLTKNRQKPEIRFTRSPGAVPMTRDVKRGTVVISLIHNCHVGIAAPAPETVNTASLYQGRGSRLQVLGTRLK